MSRERDRSTIPEDAVAVVGMAGRFPGAPDLEAFWENLATGVESVTTFTPEELAAAGVDPELAGRPEYVPAAAVLEDPERFDAELFGVSPREAALLDPQQRLFLEVAWAALEDAGLDPRGAPGRPGARAGVFAGAGLNRYLLDHVYPALDAADPAAAYQAALANDKDFLATRVAYKLGLEGPALTVQTACSTSLVAVALACQSVAGGDCDLAVAGGATLRLPLRAGYLFQEEGILSPDGHCRAFDAAGRGTVPGSGVGAVVLERLEDALAAGHPVRAVIRGWATNNDGADKAGYTAPRAEGQSRVVAEALALAGLEPATVGYVEAHGTGTRLGDPIEVAALARAFGPDVPPGSVALGSVKSNIGHLDAAAGLAGLTKAVLALEREAIPPTLHFREPNPEIDFAGGPFRVVTDLIPWPRARQPRRAGVSSFGIGGTNAHVVLEEAPVRKEEPPRAAAGPRLFAVSAKTPETLDRACARLAEDFRKRPEADAPDAARTLLAGRAALDRRRAVVAGSLAEAADLLAGADPSRLRDGVAEPGRAPVAFLLPGQGSQYSGMGAGLYERLPVFRRELDRAAEILEPHLEGLAGGAVQLLGSQRASPDGAAEADPLEDTALAQPVLFAVEHALARLWMSWGVEPDALLGHSVGELVAACLAGVIELEEALPLVAARGRLVADLPGGAMLAVPLSEEELARRLDGRDGFTLAAVNAPELCAVSGPEEAVADLAAELDAEGLAVRRLHTSHAFHAPLVEPAVEPFRERVARCRLRPPRIPFLSNVTGTWITDDQATDPGYWARHLRAPVRFAPAVAELLAEPRRALLEVGPGNALTRLAGRHPLLKEERRQGRRRAVVASLPHAADPASDADTLLTAAAELWVAGVGVGEGFGELDGPEDGPPRRLRLPTYPFAGERHWIEARERAPGGPPAAGAPPREAGWSGTVVKEPDLADWFYVPLWRRALPLEALSRPEDAGPAEERPGWLVLSGAPAGEGLGEALAAEIARRGEPAVLVSAGPELELGGEAGRWTLPLDGPAVEEGLDALAKALAEEGSFPGRVACLWGLEPPPDDRASRGGAGGDRTGFIALLALVRTLSRRLHGRPVELAVVTDRLFDVAGEGGRNPERAALAGLARVVPQEHPAIRCRSIDLALRSGDDGGGAGDRPDHPATTMLAHRGARGGAPAARALVEEIVRGAGGPLVALRGPHRFEPVYERVRPPEPAGAALEPAGHYLVTGGLGRFGLALARHLGRRRAELSEDGSVPGSSLRLTLLDRRAPEGEVAGELDALRTAGVEVAALQADLADREATTRALAEAVERSGPLAGVVHAAGAPSSAFRTLAELRPADWREHLEPKLTGAVSLAHALEGLATPPPAWVVCASSLAPVLGGVGLAPFAGADAALDALAETFDRERRGGARWRSVNWEGWEAPGGTVAEDAGGASALGALGRQQATLTMTPEEVGEAFERALALPGPPRLVAATGDLPARIAQWSDVLRRRAAGPGGAGRGRPAGAPPFRPPEGEAESRVAAVWEELLGVDEIGRDDDFFLFGGDSLVGLQVLSRLRAELDVELPLRSFFEGRTVAGIAAVIEEERLRSKEEALRTAEILAEIEALSDEEAVAELAREGAE